MFEFDFPKKGNDEQNLTLDGLLEGAARSVFAFSFLKKVNEGPSLPHVCT